MPKVLRILNRFNIGGPIYNAALLTKFLAPKYETMLIGGANEAQEKDAFHILDELGLKHHIVPDMGRSINPLDDYKALRAIEQIIDEFQPDIVHTHASKAGALGRIAASRKNVKAIVHTFHGHVFHSYFPKWKTNIYKSVERYLANKSNHIITISESQFSEIVHDHKIVSPDKASVIPLGFDLHKFFDNQESKRIKFRQKYNLKDSTIAIGIAGRLAPIKNHDLFLDSICHLKNNSDKKWQAFIIGDGECRSDLEQKCNALGISHSDKPDPSKEVVFTSFLTEMDDVMAGLDIVVLSSKNEGTPVSLIEAQAAAKPILTTDVGGINNVVVQDKTAIVAPLKDPIEFNNGLVKLVNNEELRMKFAKNGPEVVKRKFHYTRLVKDMDELYRKLLD